MTRNVTLLARSDSTTFKPVPTGIHTAVLVQIIDLGMQESNFNGEEKRRHQVWFQWELPEQELDDGKPMTIGRRYTLSFHEKAALRKHMEQWMGRSFDEAEVKLGYNLANRLGKGCTLVVSHNTKGDKTYANIDAISQAPGTFVPDPFNDPIIYVRGASSAEDLAALPQWAQEANAAADEIEKRFKQVPKQGHIPGYEDEDVPVSVTG